jgi:hypothetical protein
MTEGATAAGCCSRPVVLLTGLAEAGLLASSNRARPHHCASPDIL